MNQEQWTFETLQRILSDTSIWRVTILGLMFSLNPLGIGGLYYLIENEPNKFWVIALSSAMMFISLTLTIIHHRERKLFEAARDKLKRMQVEFPTEDTFWIGFNKIMIMFLYLAAILWWGFAMIFFGLY